VFFEGVKEMIQAGESGRLADFGYPEIPGAQDALCPVQPGGDEVFVGGKAGVFFELMTQMVLADKEPFR
jgi:hypothetical protein